MKKMQTIRRGWATARSWARRHRRLWGLPLVYAGVALIAVSYAAGLTNYNLCLFVPVALIAAGIAGYVQHEKHGGSY